MKHRYEPGCEEHCGQCNECLLDTCMMCQASEGELTKDCPGRVVEGWKRKLVLEGKLEFTAENGWWSKEFNMPVVEMEIKTNNIPLSEALKRVREFENGRKLEK